MTAVAQTILRHWLPACVLGVLIGYVAASGCSAQDGPDQPRTEPPPDGVWLLTVEIPELLDDETIKSKYADPLAAALRAQDFGDVSDSGQRLRPDGRRTGCYIDADVTVLDPALRLMIATLRNQGAPERSRIDLLDPLGLPIPVWNTR